MYNFFIWLILSCIAIYLNQKANSDAGKLAKDIKDQEPDFFLKSSSLFADLTKIQSSSFIFMLLNNQYKKLKNPEFLKRGKKIKQMSLLSTGAGFILIAIALLYLIHHGKIFV